MKYRTITAVFSCLMLAGCGSLPNSGEDRKEKPSMNMEEAAHFSDKVLDETLDAISPPVQWAHGQPTDASCGDDPDAPENTGTVTRRRVITTIISDARRGAFLGVVERAWKKQGYKITATQGDKKMPSMYAATPDDFRMGLTIGYKGQAFLEITSPCMTKSEVPDPGAKPNGPDYAPGEIPTPNVRSSFWSE